MKEDVFPKSCDREEKEGKKTRRQSRERRLYEERRIFDVM